MTIETRYPVVESLLTWVKCGDGCPESPDWDGYVELDSVEEEAEDGESIADRLRQVIESPLWALVRNFLTSEDVLHVRTTGIKWNIAWLYGPFAEFFFFLLEKDDDKRTPVPPPNGQVCDMTTDNSMDSTIGLLNQGSYLD